MQQYVSFPFNNFISIRNRFRRMQITTECRAVAAERVTPRFVANYNYDFANTVVVVVVAAAVVQTLTVPGYQGVMRVCETLWRISKSVSALEK